MEEGLQALRENLDPAGKILAPAIKPTHALLRNVLVYSLADKYHIPSLSVLAKAKFQHLAPRGLLPSHDFREIIRLIYSTTPSNDRGLRDIASEICTTGAEKLTEGDLRITVIENVEFGLDMLKGFIRIGTQKDDNQRLTDEKLGKKEEELKKLEKNSASDKLKHSAEIERPRALKRTTNSSKKRKRESTVDGNKAEQILTGTYRLWNGRVK